MKKNSFTELSDEALIKKYNLMKAVIIAFSILYFVVILVLLYLFLIKNFGQISVAFFVPLLIFPAVMAPCYISYNMLRAEKKLRNL